MLTKEEMRDTYEEAIELPEDLFDEDFMSYSGRYNHYGPCLSLSDVRRPRWISYSPPKEDSFKMKISSCEREELNDRGLCTVQSQKGCTCDLCLVQNSVQGLFIDVLEIETLPQCLVSGISTKRICLGNQQDVLSTLGDILRIDLPDEFVRPKVPLWQRKEISLELTKSGIFLGNSIMTGTSIKGSDFDFHYYNGSDLHRCKTVLDVLAKYDFSDFGGVDLHPKKKSFIHCAFMKVHQRLWSLLETYYPELPLRISYLRTNPGMKYFAYALTCALLNISAPWDLGYMVPIKYDDVTPEISFDLKPFAVFQHPGSNFHSALKDGTLFTGFVGYFEHYDMMEDYYCEHGYD